MTVKGNVDEEAETLLPSLSTDGIPHTGLVVGTGAASTPDVSRPRLEDCPQEVTRGGRDLCS